MTTRRNNNVLLPLLLVAVVASMLMVFFLCQRKCDYSFFSCTNDDPATTTATTTTAYPSTTKATKSTTTAGKNNAIRVACVGDSITNPGGCDGNLNTSYPTQLQSILGPDYLVMNFGASGRTMLKKGKWGNKDECPGSLGDGSYWNTTTFVDAIQSNPDIVTIMLGTNDAKYCNWYGRPNGSPPGIGIEYRSAYLDMISIFKSLPSQPKVYLAIPPPLVHPPTDPIQPPPYNMTAKVANEIFPVLIRSIAIESNVDGIIDVWSALGGIGGYQHIDMTCDGCHPKPSAKKIIAETFSDIISMIGEGGEGLLFGDESSLK